MGSPLTAEIDILVRLGSCLESVGNNLLPSSCQQCQDSLQLWLEGPLSLPAASLGPLSAPQGCLHPLSCAISAIFKTSDGVIVTPWIPPTFSSSIILRKLSCDKIRLFCHIRGKPRGHEGHAGHFETTYRTDQGKMGRCVCTAEFLHCSPETIAALLIGYTPMQNKKFKRKKDWEGFPWLSSG